MMISAFAWCWHLQLLINLHFTLKKISSIILLAVEILKFSTILSTKEICKFNLNISARGYDVRTKN